MGINTMVVLRQRRGPAWLATLPLAEAQPTDQLSP